MKGQRCLVTNAPLFLVGVVLMGVVRRAMIVGYKKTCRQIFGDFRPVSICAGKPAKKTNFPWCFSPFFVEKGSRNGNREAKKLQMYPGRGIWDLWHDRWRISVLEGEEPIYIYILGNCPKPVLHWVHSLFIFMNPKNLQGFHWFSSIWAGPNKYSTLRSWFYYKRNQHIYMYIHPGTQITSIFEGQPRKTRPFPIKTRVIWVPGIYVYIYINNCIYGAPLQNSGPPQMIIGSITD